MTAKKDSKKELAKVELGVVDQMKILVQQEPLIVKQRFQQLLNTPIPEKLLAVKYGKEGLPIGQVERFLDCMFFSQWETTNFHWQLFANEIVGSIELRVIYPVTNYERVLTGAASIQIMVHKDENPLDVTKKKPNALEMGFPKLKAMCVKNAAKQLGILFGRDLNRSYVAKDSRLISDDKEAEILDSVLNGEEV